MRRNIITVLVIAAIVASIYIDINQEKLYFKRIPDGGVVLTESAVNGGFKKTESDVEISIAEFVTGVEPFSMAFAGNDLYFLGKGWIDDHYDGTIGLYKLSGEEDGKLYALQQDASYLQKEEWSDLHSLGDVLVWTKKYRLNWNEYSYERAAYHSESGYAAVPVVLQNQDADCLMRWNDTLYWFEGAEVSVDLKMWKEGIDSRTLGKNVFRPVTHAGTLKTGLLAYEEDKYIIRMNLDTNKPLDKFIHGDYSGLQNIFCNDNYIVYSDYNKNTYCYKISEGKSYHMIQGEDNQAAAWTFLDDNWMIYIQGNQFILFDLETMTVQNTVLPHSHYADFILTEDGSILGCNKDARCLITVKYN